MKWQQLDGICSTMETITEVIPGVHFKIEEASMDTLSPIYLMVIIMLNEVVPRSNEYGWRIKHVRSDQPKLIITAHSCTVWNHIFGVMCKQYSADLNADRCSLEFGHRYTIVHQSHDRKDTGIFVAQKHTVMYWVWEFIILGNRELRDQRSMWAYTIVWCLRYLEIPTPTSILPFQLPNGVVQRPTEVLHQTLLITKNNGRRDYSVTVSISTNVKLRPKWKSCSDQSPVYLMVLYSYLVWQGRWFGMPQSIHYTMCR